jgi:predicted ATP-dependent endonuclease of OLD family
MIQRYVKIKNFRNIGNNAYQKFELNAIPDSKNKLGGLVTLIGMNNTGKSNYLDALHVLETKEITTNDEPFLRYEDDRDPTITLWLRDTDPKTKTVTDYQYKVKKDHVYIDQFVDEKKVKSSPQENDVLTVDLNQNHLNLLNNMNKVDVCQTVYNHWVQQNRNRAIKKETFPFSGDFAKYVEVISRVLHKKATHSDFKRLVELMEIPSFGHIAQRHYGFANTNTIKAFVEYLKENMSGDERHPVMEEVEKKYGFQLVPNIIKYDDSLTFNKDDMVSPANEASLENPDFFQTLFALLKKSKFEELETAYEKFHEYGNGIHFLNNLQVRVNKDLEKLSETFNKIYGYANDKQYRFTLKLESTTVYFILSENDTAVPFDSQSAGFKWFFNFFFNVFANEELENGDIVILDEPATNLHVSGQIELRKQIKRFGIENGITFVLSTHSPFLIDVDHLDELRIVAKQDNYSFIENKFSVSDDRLIDALTPIQSSLTIGRHVISDPDKTLIFVEGITDYNYLVAFKEYLGYESLSFLPVQGIKDTSKVFKSLINSFKNPVILVDSDFYGQKAKDTANNHKHVGIEVRELSEFDSKFKFIEDLFSEADRTTFIPEKSYDRSAHFKSHFNQYKSKLSKETIANFKAVLKGISV